MYVKSIYDEAIYLLDDYRRDERPAGFLVGRGPTDRGRFHVLGTASGPLNAGALHDQHRGRNAHHREHASLDLAARVHVAV